MTSVWGSLNRIGVIGLCSSVVAKVGIDLPGIVALGQNLLDRLPEVSAGSVGGSLGEAELSASGGFP
ncbi:hypothetical protein R1sor_009589 [Riccia sorocarpa]|uniref:Uncharacterized protein n=1 Tax=Riccia sorocarpa TaxID=122646 RepID=A0ABD3HVS9_9MARC